MFKLRKLLRRMFGIGAVVALALGVYSWQAIGHVDPFYRQAIRLKPEVLKQGSAEVETRLNELAKRSQQPQPWNAEFTDVQLNGWLAVAMALKHQDELPRGMSDFRIAFQENVIVLGFRYAEKGIDTVVTLTLAPYVRDTNMLGVKLVSARAGSLPIPLNKVARQLSAGAANLQIPLVWTEREGQPVALVPLAAAVSTVEQRRELEKVVVRDGALQLTGRTRLVDSVERLAKLRSKARR